MINLALQRIKRGIQQQRVFKSSELWPSQLGMQFLQLRSGAWKIQNFNAVWTRDLRIPGIPVRRSNQLTYETTDVGSWSFVGSHVRVMN